MSSGLNFFADFPEAILLPIPEEYAAGTKLAPIEVRLQSARKLNKNLIEMQGNIDINAWNEKASADEGAAQAAQAGGIGGILGGIVQVAGLRNTFPLIFASCCQGCRFPFLDQPHYILNVPRALLKATGHSRGEGLALLALGSFSHWSGFL